MISVNEKELPSSDRYLVSKEPESDKLKKSFCLPWDTYSKIYLPYKKH